MNQMVKKFIEILEQVIAKNRFEKINNGKLILTSLTKVSK
jgi:hypothetical protein